MVDANEFEAIPPPPPPKVLGEIDRSQLPLEAREKLALAEARKDAYVEEARSQPDSDWKNLPALLGLPVELDTSATQRQPWLTYAVAGLIALASGLAFFHLKPAIHNYGLIPADVWKRYGLTLFTSFFLHAGIFHLLGNLYFLVTFGRAVEDCVGRTRWLILLVSAALIGNLGHIALDPQSTLPCVGASGGISGILAFYAFKFPHAKIGLFLRFGLYARWQSMPAYVAFGLWIVLQLWGVFKQMYGYSHVSALAHLGGVIAGVVLWWAWKDLDAKPALDGGLFKVIR